MDTEIDLYKELSAILGKTLTADTPLDLSNAEWEKLPEASKDAIEQLLELAMHYPSLVFPEGTGAAAVDPASLPEPNLPSWAELMAQEQEAEDAKAGTPISLPPASSNVVMFGNWFERSPQDLVRSCAADALAALRLRGTLDHAAQQVLDHVLVGWVTAAVSRPGAVESMAELRALCAMGQNCLDESAGAADMRARWQVLANALGAHEALQKILPVPPSQEDSPPKPSSSSTTRYGAVFTFKRAA